MLNVVCKFECNYKALLDKIEALPSMLQSCPQCKALSDERYGWAPVLRIVPIAYIDDVLFVSKEACWACGYHKSQHVCVTGWSRTERLVFGLLFEITEKRWFTAQEIVDVRLYEGKGIA